MTAWSISQHAFDHLNLVYKSMCDDCVYHMEEWNKSLKELKRTAKLLTVIGFTTKHVVCRITFMLYPVLL